VNVGSPAPTESLSPVIPSHQIIKCNLQRRLKDVYNSFYSSDYPKIFRISESKVHDLMTLKYRSVVVVVHWHMHFVLGPVSTSF